MALSLDTPLIAFPRDHSRFGASPAHRWSVCTASVRAQAGLPDRPSEAAELGTAAHFLIELCLAVDKDSEFFVGKSIEVRHKTDEPGNSYEIDVDMCEDAQLFLDTVRADLAEMPQAKLFAEQSFYLPQIHTDSHGSVDAMIVQPMGLLRVYEYKNGRVLVDVEDNAQEKMYGIGGLSLPEAFGVEEIELVVVQPKDFANKVKRWRTTPEALLAYTETLHAKALEAEAGGKFVPGEHCTHCRYEVDCAAKRAMILPAEVCEFDPIEDQTRQLKAPAPPSYLTSAQLDRWMELAELLEPHFAQVKAAIRAKLERGDSDASKMFKLVEGKKSRKWASDEAVLDLCLPPDICYERSIRSPAQMEKALKAAKLDPRIIDAAVTTSRGVTMAPVSDPRPAVLRSAPFQPILIPE